MAIQKGDIIKVEYEGRLKDGTIFDSTERNQGIPLKFEVGAGHIIPGFENSVLGKDVGEEYEVKITPSDAYGDYDDQAIETISKEQFPKGPEPQSGMMLLVMGPHGPMPATIKEVVDDMVTLDLNHPLAGKDLTFKIKILETGCEPDPPEACGCGCESEPQDACGCGCGHDHEHKH